jgi:hypothetical protein
VSAAYKVDEAFILRLHTEKMCDVFLYSFYIFLKDYFGLMMPRPAVHPSAAAQIIAQKDGMVARHPQIYSILKGVFADMSFLSFFFV